VFLSPYAFKRGDDTVGYLPLKNKGCGYHFLDWVYHKECIAKPHPIFAGLPGRGVLNWEYYDQVIPRFVFDEQDTPDDVAAVWFATGYQDGSLGPKFKDSYGAGLLFAGYRLGQGRFYINTFRLLENLNAHPAADHMLMNIVRYVQNDAKRPLAAIPSDFDTLRNQLYA
jgi:hypothetical protein